MKPGPQGLCKHMNSVETLPKWQQFKTKNKTHVPDSSWHCLQSSILCIQSSRWGSLHAPSAICRLNSAALPRLLSSKIWGSQGSESDLSHCKARCAWDVHQLMPAYASHCQPWCLGVRSPVVELKSRNGWNLSDSCLGCIVRRQRPWWTGKWQRSKHLQHFMVISWSFNGHFMVISWSWVISCFAIPLQKWCSALHTAKNHNLQMHQLYAIMSRYVKCQLYSPRGRGSRHCAGQHCFIAGANRRLSRSNPWPVHFLAQTFSGHPTTFVRDRLQLQSLHQAKQAKKINMKPALRSRELGLMLRLRQILTTNMSSHRKPSKMQSLCLAIARCRAMSQHTAAHVKLV